MTTGPALTATTIAEHLVVRIGQDFSVISSGPRSELGHLFREVREALGNPDLIDRDFTAAIESLIRTGHVIEDEVNGQYRVLQIPAGDCQYCSESQLVAYARGIVDDPDAYVVVDPDAEQLDALHREVAEAAARLREARNALADADEAFQVVRKEARQADLALENALDAYMTACGRDPGEY